MGYAVPRSRMRTVIGLMLLAGSLAALALGLLVLRDDTTAASPGAARPTVALNSGGIEREPSADAVAALGARHVRVEFPIEASAESLRPILTRYADRGIQVLLLAGFDGRLPSPEEARNLATWAREYGPDGDFWADRDDPELTVRTIEFGNETAYAGQGTQNRAGEYAERFRDAHEAIEGEEGNAAVGLLAQADDANTGSDKWVEWMFEAVPDLGRRVAGWTIHPYGPEWEDRVDRLLQQTEDEGAPADVPVHVTEWGLAVDDGRCLSGNYGWEPCMTSDDAASTLREVLDGLRTRLGARLASFVVYQATDQRDPGSTDEREHYFGALRRDGSSKGAYSDEVRRQLATAPRPGDDG